MNCETLAATQHEPFVSSDEFGTNTWCMLQVFWGKSVCKIRFLLCVIVDPFFPSCCRLFFGILPRFISVRSFVFWSLYIVLVPNQQWTQRLSHLRIQTSTERSLFYWGFRLCCTGKKEKVLNNAVEKIAWEPQTDLSECVYMGGKEYKHGVAAPPSPHCVCNVFICFALSGGPNPSDLNSFSHSRESTSDPKTSTPLQVSVYRVWLFFSRSSYFCQLLSEPLY